jgi:hypothetical protein
LVIYDVIQQEKEEKRKKEEEENKLDPNALKEKRAAEWAAKYHDKKKTNHYAKLGANFAQKGGLQRSTSVSSSARPSLHVTTFQRDFNRSLSSLSPSSNDAHYSNKSNFSSSFVSQEDTGSSYKSDSHIPCEPHTADSNLDSEDTEFGFDKSESHSSQPDLFETEISTKDISPTIPEGKYSDEIPSRSIEKSYSSEKVDNTVITEEGNVPIVTSARISFSSVGDSNNSSPRNSRPTSTNLKLSKNILKEDAKLLARNRAMTNADINRERRNSVEAKISLPSISTKDPVIEQKEEPIIPPVSVSSESVVAISDSSSDVAVTVSENDISKSISEIPSIGPVESVEDASDVGSHMVHMFEPVSESADIEGDKDDTQMFDISSVTIMKHQDTLNTTDSISSSTVQIRIISEPPAIALDRQESNENISTETSLKRKLSKEEAKQMARMKALSKADSNRNR